MIVLTTTAGTIEEAVEQVRTNRRWIGGVELRVDLLETEHRRSLASFPGMLEGAGLTGANDALMLIATVRRTSDGGRSELADADRLGLLRSAARAGFTAIDLEGDLDHTLERSLLGEAASRNVTVIRSMHDFSGVPADLASVARRLPRNEGEIAKCAVTPRSTRDLLRVLRAAESLGTVPHIILGMGEFGFATRVLVRRMGNLLTFASAPGSSAAPGHVTPELLSELYRAGTHTPSTRWFGVIGNPIAHSKSPEYHNARLRDDALDAVYLPFLVDDVPAFFELAEWLPLHGFSVTIPHKRAVMEHLGRYGDDVRAADACNTVFRSGDEWYGANTDVTGFLGPLTGRVGESLAGVPVLVLGAGGAARGVVYALLTRGARVAVWNRTPERANRLASDLAAIAGAVTGTVRAASDAPLAGEFRIVVNTTSVGMNGDGDPAPWLAFAGSELVYDIVYTPPETPFIERARKAGCGVVTGDLMFAAQAAAQYAIYRRLAPGG